MKKIISFIAALSVMSSLALGSAAPVSATEYTSYTNYSSYVMEDPNDPEAEHKSVTQDGMVFNVYKDFAYLSSCEDNEITEAVIPAEVDSVPVIGITGTPFGKCRSLKSVVLPETMQYFNWYDIIVPVVRVGSSEESSDLMPTIEKISVAENNPYYTVEDGLLYSKDMKTLIGCPPAMGMKELKISDKTEEIFNYAFVGCYDLETAVIPDNIKKIHNAAFAACVKLKSVEIPEGITQLSGDLFIQCTSLSDVKIKSKLERIGYGVFYGCSSLKELDIPDTVTYIGSNAFEDTACLEECDGIKYVDNWVVESDSSKLTNAVIREGTAGIAEWAFILCNKIEHIYVPSSVKNACALSYASSKGPAVTIDYAGKAISDRAFAGAKKMTDIYIYDPECDIFDDEKTIPDTYKEPTALDDDIIHVSSDNTSSDSGTMIAVISEIPDRNSTSGGNSASKSIMVKPEEQVTDEALPEENPYTDSPVITADETSEDVSAQNKVAIHGYRGSTAEAYAKKYNRKFIALDDEVEFKICGEYTKITSGDYKYCTDGHFAWFRDCKDGESGIIVPPEQVNGMPVVGFDLEIDLFNKDEFSSVTLNSFMRNTDGLPVDRIKEIIVSPGNPYLTYEGNVLYSADKSILYHVTDKFTDEEFVIPDTVKKIGDSAFYNAAALKKVTVPDSVEYMGYSPFNKEAYSDVSDGACYVGNWLVDNVYPAPSEIKIKEGTVGIIKGAINLRKGTHAISYPSSLKYVSDFVVNSFNDDLDTVVYVNGKSVPDNLLDTSDFTDVYFMDPECVIPDSEFTISADYHYGESNELRDTVIHGYKGSTAEAYANKYDRKFEVITEEATEKPAYGDSNCNGTVDLSDAVFIMQHISNPDVYGINGTAELHMTEQGLANSDVTGNDGVTAKDALAIQKYLLKLIPSLPEE